MLKREERTIDVYKNAGAQMRLFKSLGSKLLVDVSKVLNAKDQDIFMRILNRVDVICSRAEDNMFRDFPELSNEYIDVFYGNVRDEPRNKIDEEVIILAKKVCDELFK